MNRYYVLKHGTVHTWVGAVCALFGLLVWIGINNMSTTAANRALDKKLGEQKAKAEYWKGRYDDLSGSGTCLERMSRYEEAAG